MHPDGILFGGEGRDQITNAGVTRAESRGFVFVSPFCVGGWLYVLRGLLRDGMALCSKNLFFLQVGTSTHGRLGKGTMMCTLLNIVASHQTTRTTSYLHTTRHVTSTTPPPAPNTETFSQQIQYRSTGESRGATPNSASHRPQSQPRQLFRERDLLGLKNPPFWILPPTSPTSDFRTTPPAARFFQIDNKITAFFPHF